MRRISFVMALLLVITCCLMASCAERKSSSKSDKADKSSTDPGFIFDEWFGDKSSEAEVSFEEGEPDESYEAPEESVDTPSEDQFSEDEFSEDGFSEDETSDSEVSEDGGGDLYQDGNGLYTVKNLLPYVDFGRDTFTVCVTGNEIEGTYYSEEIAPDLYATTDAMFNEAVRWRNQKIQMEYGVEIQAYKVRNVAETIAEDCVAGMAFYDAAMPFMGRATRLAQDSMLFDLKEFEFIHLDAPWWDQAANENLSIGGKLFYTTGDISVMQKKVSFAILFNKELYEEACSPEYGSLYDLVREGKWTFDLMVEMGKRVACDSDDNGVMTYEDTWGMFGTNGVSGFYSASGYKLIAKDQNDIPYLQFGTTAESILFADEVLNACQDKSWFANTMKMTPTWTEKNVWEAAMGGFGNDRALFHYSAFSAVNKLNNYPVRDHMGIVPVPKASQDQETHFTPANIYYAYGICIPVSVEDPDFSAYMIEVLACEAKNHITPAYYEGLLKVRDFRDDDSEEMLDNFIFNNMVYDLGVLHNFGHINSMFDSLMSSNSTAIVSHLESIEVAVNEAIDDYVSSFYMFE